MPWFKVDDNLHAHPKARRAGLEAMGLWTLAGSHCMSYLTDGVVEAWFVDAWPKGAKLAAQLVKVGMWDVHPDGWAFHDWAEFQPTREAVMADREAAAERMRRVRANKPRTGGGGSSSPVPVPSPDFYKTSKSQSRSNRANVSTDAIPITAMTKKLAGQLGVTNLRAVVDAARNHCGIQITADQAYQVSVWLLDKRDTPPDAPQRWVLSCFKQSPLEIQKHVYESMDVAS